MYSLQEFLSTIDYCTTSLLKNIKKKKKKKTLIHCLIPEKPLLKPLAINQVCEPVSQILQGGVVQLGVGRGRGVRREENPEPLHKRVTRRRLAAEVCHHARHDHLLHAPLPQHLLEARALERAVGVLLQNDVVSGAEVEAGHELGLTGAVEDDVAVPPLAEHGVVGGGLVAVAREEDGDGGASAEADGGEEVGEDGVGHGGEVVLDVDDQERRGFRVWVSASDVVFLVRRGRHWRGLVSSRL